MPSATMVVRNSKIRSTIRGAKPIGRLIDEDEMGAGDVSPDDGEHLLFAAREAACGLVEPSTEDRKGAGGLLQGFVFLAPGGEDVRFSLTDREGKMPRPSGMWHNPRRAIWFIPSRVTSSPSIVMRPSLTGISPEAARRRVVLPAPLGPSRATTDEGRHLKVDVPEDGGGAVPSGDVLELEGRCVAIGAALMIVALRWSFVGVGCQGRPSRRRGLRPSEPR